MIRLSVRRLKREEFIFYSFQAIITLLYKYNLTNLIAKSVSSSSFPSKFRQVWQIKRVTALHYALCTRRTSKMYKKDFFFTHTVSLWMWKFAKQINALPTATHVFDYLPMQCIVPYHRYMHRSSEAFSTNLIYANIAWDGACSIYSLVWH